MSFPIFGAFSNGFPEQPDIASLIERFNAIGLRAVQIGDPILGRAIASEHKAERMGDALVRAGITCAGIAGYRNLVAVDETKRRDNIEHLKRCLRVAPLLGTRVVATETGSRHPTSEWSASPENRSPQAWEMLCRAIGELLPIAEEHKTVLALEGYVNNVLADYDQLDALLVKFPSDYLGVMLDPFNWITASLLPRKTEVAQEFLDRFERRFVLAHLKDLGEQGAEVSTPEFGKGVFPFETYFHFLKHRRPDLPIILEHLPADHVPDAMKRAKEMIDAV